jgi:hypothetical protein
VTGVRRHGNMPTRDAVHNVTVTCPPLRSVSVAIVGTVSTCTVLLSPHLMNHACSADDPMPPCGDLRSLHPPLPAPHGGWHAGNTYYTFFCFLPRLAFAGPSKRFVGSTFETPRATNLASSRLPLAFPGLRIELDFVPAPHMHNYTSHIPPSPLSIPPPCCETRKCECQHLVLSTSSPPSSILHPLLGPTHVPSNHRCPPSPRHSFH